MATESRSEPDFEKRDEFGNNEANVRFLRETLAKDPAERVLEIGSGRGALRAGDPRMPPTNRRPHHPVEVRVNLSARVIRCQSSERAWARASVQPQSFA